MSKQVNVLPELNTEPESRTVVGVLPQGPLFIGFGARNVRLHDTIKFGRLLSLGHLELLVGLAGSETATDTQLIESIQREFHLDPDQLARITGNFRAQPRVDAPAPDGWRPPPMSGQPVVSGQYLTLWRQTDFWPCVFLSCFVLASRDSSMSTIGATLIYG